MEDKKYKLIGADINNTCPILREHLVVIANSRFMDGLIVLLLCGTLLRGSMLNTVFSLLMKPLPLLPVIVRVVSVCRKHINAGWKHRKSQI